MEKVVQRGMCRCESGLPKSADMGETIEAPPQVTIVSRYECRGERGSEMGGGRWVPLWENGWGTMGRRGNAHWAG
jgi:hypothetical protein